MPASARLSDVATSAHSLFSPSCAVDEDSDEPNMQRQHSDPTHDEHFVDVVVAEHSVLVSVESWVVVVVVVVVVVLTFFDEVDVVLSHEVVAIYNEVVDSVSERLVDSFVVVERDIDVADSVVGLESSSNVPSRRL